MVVKDTDYQAQKAEKDANILLELSFGPEIMQFSEWMLSQGLVHFLATDAHGSKSRRPLLYRAFQKVEELAGYSTAYEVRCRNPASVVANEEVQPGRRRPRKTGLASWFPWRKAG